MRIAIAGIVHETNTYCKDQTQLADFYILRGEKMMRMRGTQTQTGAAIETCVELGMTPVPVMLANTQPSGTIAAEAYHDMKTELLDGLASAMPLDGVFLDLHGAGVVAGCPDLEADLAADVRRLVGEAVPVTAAFDLHGNVTQLMADALDGVFACHEYPHIDQHERAREAVQLIHNMLEEGYRPTVQVQTLPMLMPTTTTFHGPGMILRDRMRQAESDNPEVIDVSLGGKYDDLHGEPLALNVYVKALHDGRCTMQAMAKGSPINYGKLARLQVGGMDIVVGSRRSQTFDTEPFLAVGIDVTGKDFVALKSSNHFRAGFEHLAGAIITADPPGLTTHHIEVFPRENCETALWPVDDTARFE